MRPFLVGNRDEGDRAGFGQGSVPDDLMEEGAVYDEIATVVGDLQFLTFFILEHQGVALEVVGSALQFDVEDLDELRGLFGIGTDEERLVQRCVGLVQGDFGRLQVVFTRIGRQLAIDHRAVVAGTAGVGAAGVAATCVGIGAAGVGGVGVVATFTGAAGILLARGQRGRLDFGAFGQRDRGAVGLVLVIEDRLDLALGAADGFEGDAAVGVRVAHPDQLAKVFLADDLAFCHRLAVQQQRVLVVAVLDDEGRQFDGCVGFVRVGQRQGIGLAGAFHGIGAGIAHFAAEDPCLVAAQLVLEGVEQPVGFCLIIDLQQLAAQALGFGIGFGTGHRLGRGDDFVGGRGLVGAHWCARGFRGGRGVCTVCTTCRCRGGAGRRVGCGSFGLAVVVAVADQTGAVLIVVLAGNDAGDLDELGLLVGSNGELEAFGFQFGRAVDGDLRLVCRAGSLGGGVLDRGRGGRADTSTSTGTGASTSTSTSTSTCARVHISARGRGDVLVRGRRGRRFLDVVVVSQRRVAATATAATTGSRGHGDHAQCGSTDDDRADGSGTGCGAGRCTSLDGRCRAGCAHAGGCRGGLRGAAGVSQDFGLFGVHSLDVEFLQFFLGQGLARSLGQIGLHAFAGFGPGNGVLVRLNLVGTGRSRHVGVFSVGSGMRWMPRASGRRTDRRRIRARELAATRVAG